jgi:Zn ribbon nucleic-acid-binding protein
VSVRACFPVVSVFPSCNSHLHLPRNQSWPSPRWQAPIRHTAQPYQPPSAKFLLIAQIALSLSRLSFLLSVLVLFASVFLSHAPLPLLADMATLTDGPSRPMQPICQNCQTSTTPLWRRDEIGSVLCNACGLFLKLHGRPRPISLKTDVIKSRNRVKSSGQALKKAAKVYSPPTIQDISTQLQPQLNPSFGIQTLCPTDDLMPLPL